jgi:hypothetical protein
MHQVAVRRRVRWYIGAGIRTPCLTALGSSVRNNHLSMSGTNVLLCQQGMTSHNRPRQTDYHARIFPCSSLNSAVLYSEFGPATANLTIAAPP